MADVEEVRRWFQEHVTLAGDPYTLDLDQARAVVDAHKNTIVTARAGSGKTRVIVAKVAYLVARQNVHFSEIAAFMFNRTAAAEVNARIASVAVDGRPLLDFDSDATEVTVASTFHKFALDTVRLAGKQPEIITEGVQLSLITQAFNRVTVGQRLSPSARLNQIRLITGFISRVDQLFCGKGGQQKLEQAILTAIDTAAHDPTLAPADRKAAAARLRDFYHVAYRVYRLYLASLRPPQTDFNHLMTTGAQLLYAAAADPSGPLSAIAKHYQPLKHILLDEYQDFSYLFYSVIVALRRHCPDAHLFAVGDDWQAINRFAGSDVEYFINFSSYFPEDNTRIELRTNYRSAQAIVEHANEFMLRHYDRRAHPAVAFSKARGKIKYCKHRAIKFDATDIKGDGLGDGRYQRALLAALPASIPRDDRLLRRLIPVARLLKRTIQIIKSERGHQILLLHRHNFTSVADVTLNVFRAALYRLLVSEHILTPEEIERDLRIMTMHKSKGLEAEVVILLEANYEILLAHHADVDLFTIFGDSTTTERRDQQRLIYVALTRARERLYILTASCKPPC